MQLKPNLPEMDECTEWKTKFTKKYRLENIESEFYGANQVLSIRCSLHEAVALLLWNVIAR